MQSIQYVFKAMQVWKKRWGSYTILSIIITEFLSLVVQPIVGIATSYILKINNVPYLSYNNIGSVFFKNPLVMLELILLLLIVLIIVYFEFSILLQGVTRIFNGERIDFIAMLKRSFQDIVNMKLKDVPVFVLYLIFIIPFSNIVLSSPLLSKVKIPVFILDTLIQKPIYALGIIIFFLAITFLAIRFIRFFPIMLTGKSDFSNSARQSWTETKNKFWFYMIRIFWITVVSKGVTWIFSNILIYIQSALDNTKIALGSGIFTLTLMQVGLLVWSAFTTILFSLLVLFPNNLNSASTISKVHSKKKSLLIRIIATVGVFFLAIIFGMANYEYMTGALDQVPKVIAHRGVDGNNGVQNTIPSMIKTAKKGPDYIEMDVHETKDRQFVVIHDENLTELAGVNKVPRDLTLKELTNMNVHENGNTAKIPSFDEYLKTSEDIKQPLLVELKTTKEDSKDVIELFFKKYGNRLVKDGYPMHSLDYNVIKKGKKLYPKLFIGFISPYSLTFPQTKADAYTNEETSIDIDFITAANTAKKEIWAWTVDDEDDMRSMMFLGVDGIITNDMSKLKAIIKQETSHPSYSQRLKNYAKNTLLIEKRNGIEN